MMPTGYGTTDGEVSAGIREQKKSAMRRLIAESENRQPDCCAQCGSRRMGKYGKTGKGTQRYYCQKCGKTCVSQGLISGSHLTEDQWFTFSGCRIDGMLVRESSEEAGVSLSTGYRMDKALKVLEYGLAIEDRGAVAVKSTCYTHDCRCIAAD